MSNCTTTETTPLSKSQIELLTAITHGPRPVTNPTPQDALALIRRGFARLDRHTGLLAITPFGRRWLNATP